MGKHDSNSGKSIRTIKDIAGAVGKRASRLQGGAQGGEAYLRLVQDAGVLEAANFVILQGEKARLCGEYVGRGAA